ncbi:M23 family metallopeptidase, partial [Acinetobacter baumannii]
MKTYRFPGNLPEHFYCYNKPVLAPADGTVVEIIDFIEDNEIGGNNTQQNWGNTIVIKHAEGLYTKLSHLTKHSFKVAKGA